MNTTQVTQLMEMLINSALMTTACTLLLGGLLSYRTASHYELQTIRQLYRETFQQLGKSSNDQILNYKTQLRQLHARQRGLDYQVLGTAMALLIFVSSVLFLALSMLIPWLWLVRASLWIFVFGSSCLVLTVFTTLVQLWQEHQIDITRVFVLWPHHQHTRCQPSNKSQPLTHQTNGHRSTDPIPYEASNLNDDYENREEQGRSKTQYPKPIAHSPSLKVVTIVNERNSKKMSDLL